MPKAKNPKADEAETLYRKGLKLVEIAKQLELPAGTIRRWKSTYKWDNERSKKMKANVRKKRGAPKGNKNATGPPGNKNAEKFGFFSKYLPEETLDIFRETLEANPIDLLWHQIQIAYAAIIRAQQIGYVKNQEDATVNRVGYSTGKIKSEKFEIQNAWDKQNDFLKAQARAQAELRNMIKQYDEMLHANWDSATEEQKARIEKIKAETSKIKGEELKETLDDDGFITALQGKVDETWQD